MKKKVICGALVVAASVVSTSVFAADPCEVALCMFGLVDGQSSSQCQGAIVSYFSMIAWHNGHPDLAATASQRLSFTSQCRQAGGQALGAIDKAFGSVIR
jgi:hypothetical protein